MISSKLTLFLTFIAGVISGSVSIFLFFIWKSRKELEKYNNQFPIDKMVNFPGLMDVSDDQINDLMKNFLKKGEIQNFVAGMRKNHGKPKGKK